MAATVLQTISNNVMSVILIANIIMTFIYEMDVRSVRQLLA